VGRFRLLATLTLPQLLSSATLRGDKSLAYTKILGKPGGFGAVHLGQGRDGKEVAIKIINPEVGDLANRELEFAEAFAGRLTTNVIPILDAGVDPTVGCSCIVMALASGNLRERLRGGATLTEDEATEILIQIARGLIEAGDWVHRDLKPENVLYADGRWQIGDFGIARLAEAETATLTLKRARSPWYAAPEQWSRQHATHATDIYALGCIGIELITGHLPFQGPAEPDYERQHLYELPLLTGVPPLLRGLLVRMVAKPQVARPAVERVIQELESYRKKGQASGPGAHSLAGVSATLETQKAEADARRAAAEAALQERVQTATHALSILDGIAEQLFAEVQKHASAARITREKRDTVTIRQATMGKGTIRMTVGGYDLIKNDVFAGSAWDVICGDGIFVEVVGTGNSRGASLWYADVDRKGQYEWIEMGYYRHGAKHFHGSPQYLPPGTEARIAASSPEVHPWRFAHPIRRIEGHPATDEFCQRWMFLFGRAAEGTLRAPETLPES
jgi:eukaryotic-like serine/threonine-protein kinase